MQALKLAGFLDFWYFQFYTFVQGWEDSAASEKMQDKQIKIG